MIRVFIVDDHIIFREGLKRVIMATSDIVVADEAGDGRSALTHILENTYDVALLDLALPGMSGLEVLRAVKAQKPNLPVLVLSIYPEEQYALRVLKEGASGYLTKESVPSELIKAIRTAAQGGRYIGRSLAEKLDGDENGDGVVEPHERLSGREYQVFQMIAGAKTMKEIAGKLKLAPTTVSSYRTRILEKMNMRTNGDLIRYAIEHGLTD